MCCRVEEYPRYLQLFEQKRVESLHFDVMDGRFVPNMMMGTHLYADTKRLTTVPVHLHLMTEKPEQTVDVFAPRAGDGVFIHPESTGRIYKTLESLRNAHVLAGVALNPGTPIGVLSELFEVLDAVMVMTVNPGFAGQSVVGNALRKIRRVRDMLDEADLQHVSVSVDGSTTPANAADMRRAGADGFVVGTSSLLQSADVFARDYDGYLDGLREAAA